MFIIKACGLKEIETKFCFFLKNLEEKKRKS